MDIPFTYLSFQGRIGRAHFAVGLLLLTAVSVCIASAGALLMRALPGPLALLLGLAMLAWFGANVFAACALYAKRLHDVGVSGWGGAWIQGVMIAGAAVSPFAPKIGVFLMLVGSLLGLILVVAPGEPSENAWGRAPGARDPALLPAE